ncbi:hypothetical protein [Streptomyces tubercidicus]|uniref:hypothetical protein n=1 Tax=Streptomyces tubercidicus TaxID=47759 RepID=UPI0036C21D6F
MATAADGLRRAPKLSQERTFAWDARHRCIHLIAATGMLRTIIGLVVGLASRTTHCSTWTTRLPEWFQ